MIGEHLLSHEPNIKKKCTYRCKLSNQLPVGVMHESYATFFRARSTYTIMNRSVTEGGSNDKTLLKILPHSWSFLIPSNDRLWGLNQATGTSDV